MPPLREWDIASLEDACGGPFAPGRLGKLERAGLLGQPVDSTLVIEDDGLLSSGNPLGGVVLTKEAGVDPAVMQALRALVSTSSEWDAAGEAVGNFATEVSTENERRARLAARTAIDMELAGKATSIDEDKDLLRRGQNSKSGVDTEELLAIRFRLEKKKLLKAALERLG
jgi:Rubisco LSMT substrate-binding